MKVHAFLMLGLMVFPLGASEILAPEVERASLPKHWYLRDASAFAKLGLTPQMLVYQPTKDQRPLATVSIESRPLAPRLPDDAHAWAKFLIPTPPGPSWKMETPSLTVRGGRRIWRAEMIADTNADNQHWILMQAMENDGAVLVMVFEQTRDFYKERVPFVLDLFEHVRPTPKPSI